MDPAINRWPGGKVSRLLAVDTGEKHNGAVIVDMTESPPKLLKSWNDITQEELAHLVCDVRDDHGAQWLAVERIAARGMSVGQETIDTAELVGIVRALFGIYRSTRIFRSDVKIELCGTSRAKDKNVSQAIRDLYPSVGVGRYPQVGTQKKPGPLFGLAKHGWSAMAVAVAWQILERQKGALETAGEPQ